MVVGVFGTVDHLVNNAGVLQQGFFEDFTQFYDISSLMVIRLACMIAFLILSYFCNKFATVIVIGITKKKKKKKIVIGYCLLDNLIMSSEVRNILDYSNWIG
jgi:NAD(P)-dependent dehydrogenase (short-subunit alcohol dehydrogenase family)